MTNTYYREAGYEIQGFLHSNGSVSVYEVFFGIEENFVVTVPTARVTSVVLALLDDSNF